MTEIEGASKDSLRAKVWRVLAMVPILVGFWLLLSGHYDPLLLGLGAVSVAVVCGMAWRGELYLHPDVTIRFVLRLPLYFVWLAWEVFRSALGVVRKVWSPRSDLRPVVAATDSTALSELEQVVYTNSITLTPGTLSLDVDDDRILVHSLDAADIEALRDGAMLRQVRKLGGRR